MGLQVSYLSMWPILLPYGIGAVVGMYAILLALLRQQQSARKAAWFSIAVGTLYVATFGVLPHLIYLAGIKPPFPAPFLWYVVIALPMILGVVALGFGRRYDDMEPARIGPVPRAALVYVVAVIAGGIAGGSALCRAVHLHHHRDYYQKRDLYLADFRSLPGVENVYVEPWEHEGYYYAGAIEFTIKGVPDSFVKLAENRSILGQLDGDVEYLGLVQLGPWQFHDHHASCLDLGTDGRHSHLLPVEIHSVADIVERYRELVAFFQVTEVPGVTVVVAEDRKRGTRPPSG